MPTLGVGFQSLGGFLTSMRAMDSSDSLHFRNGYADNEKPFSRSRYRTV